MKKLKRQNTEKPKRSGLVKYVFVISSILIVTISLLVFFIFSRDFGDNYVISVHEDSGQGSVLVFSFSEEKITKFILPKETLMDVARQRGEWRMQSVWKLIESEKLPKTMYSDTLIKSLNVPVNSWSNETSLGLFENNPIKNFKFVFNPVSSNISFTDKISLVIFSSQIRTRDREEINFTETTYLTETRLADGENGYVRANQLSSKLRHYFVSDSFSENPAKVEVINKTGSGKLQIDTMLSTIETIGMHVFSLKEEDQDLKLYCKVESSSQNDQVRKIIEVFGCNFSKANTGNFDIKITLGKRFVERF